MTLIFSFHCKHSSPFHCLSHTICFRRFHQIHTWNKWTLNITITSWLTLFQCPLHNDMSFHYLTLFQIIQPPITHRFRWLSNVLCIKWICFPLSRCWLLNCWMFHGRFSDRFTPRNDWTRLFGQKMSWDRLVRSWSLMFVAIGVHDQQLLAKKDRKGNLVLCCSGKYQKVQITWFSRI